LKQSRVTLTHARWGDEVWAEAAAGAERCHISTVVTNKYFVCSVCSNRETALGG
jgi:hypothetical protein